MNIGQETTLEQAIWQTLTDHGVTTNKAELVQALIDAFDSFADAPRTDGAKRKRRADLHFEALAAVCKMTPARNKANEIEWSKLTKTEAGMLNRFTKQLRDASATPEQIKSFGAWWYANDFRGQRDHKPPTPANVVQLWTRYMTANGSSGETVGSHWAKFLKEYRAGAE